MEVQSNSLYQIEDRTHALEILLGIIFRYDLETPMIEAIEGYRKELIPRGTPEFGYAIGDKIWLCHALSELKRKE